MSVILCNTKLDCDMAKERGIVAEILSFKHFEEELNSLLARSSLVSRQVCVSIFTRERDWALLERRGRGWAELSN